MREFPTAQLTLDNLIKAYFDCRRRKTNTRQAMDFEIDREHNLFQLYQELVDGTYKIGRSICFVVLDPKPREIWAGQFRDRIVHHLIYNALYDRYISRLIYDTYSCIPNRGNLACVLRAEKFAKNVTQNYSVPAYYCKMDIQNYFATIDKKIMFDCVAELIDKEKEKWLYDLVEQVIFHDPRTNYLLKSPKEYWDKLPAYKSLFNSDDMHGLPIGNLTSQFFSNIYLNKVDQYAKHVLKCRHYIRYVDDIILFDKSAGFLNHAYAKINRFLEDELNLKLNHKKKDMNLLIRGFKFIGIVFKPNHKHVQHRTTQKFINTIKDWENSENRFSKEELYAFRKRINCYYGFLKHTNSYNFRKSYSPRVTTLFTKNDKDYLKVQVVSA